MNLIGRDVTTISFVDNPKGADALFVDVDKVKLFYSAAVIVYSIEISYTFHLLSPVYIAFAFTWQSEKILYLSRIVLCT